MSRKQQFKYLDVSFTSAILLGSGIVRRLLPQISFGKYLYHLILTVVRVSDYQFNFSTSFIVLGSPKVLSSCTKRAEEATYVLNIDI